MWNTKYDHIWREEVAWRFVQKLTTKLNFKKRQLSKAAAAGKDTSSLQAEISKLEAAIAEMD